MLKKTLAGIVSGIMLFSSCNAGFTDTNTYIKKGSVRSTVNVNKPFPQSISFNGVIKPDLSQSIMNTQIMQYYDSWKGTYGKDYPFTNGALDKSGVGFIIKGEANGNIWKWGGKQSVSTSEAHGYGMLTFALMAGYDPEAKTLFDKMYKTKANFPSLYSPNLMSWVVPIDGDLSIQKQACATDGDMDIAYALLLADKQWGGGPEGYDITYKQAALDIINDLGYMAVHKDTGKHFPRLGTSEDMWSKAYTFRATRASDFLVGHMDVFAGTGAEAASEWAAVQESTINIVDFVQRTMSPSSGLLPEFMGNQTDDFNVDIQTFTGISDEYGGAYDNTYYYNSSRFPWRYSMAYAESGDPRIKAGLNKINTWLIKNHQTHGVYDPEKTRPGYLLSGAVDTRHYPYSSRNFKASFMAGLAVSGDITSLTTAWNNIKDFDPPNQWGSNYYENSITLLSMLFVSGNWWSPAETGIVDKAPLQPGKPSALNITKTSADIVWGESTDDGSVVSYRVFVDDNYYQTVSVNSLTLDMLTEDREYKVSIRAVDNSNLLSRMSEVCTFITLGALNPVPGIPGTPRVTELTETSALLTWTPSEDTDLKGYMISVNNSPETFITASEYALTGLSAGAEYSVTVQGIDSQDQRSEPAAVVFTTKGGSGPVIPEDLNATAVPTASSLSKNVWNGEHTYTITSNMWYGQNATVAELYENGILVKRVSLTGNTPAHQKIEFSVAGKAVGSYTYQCKLYNQHGVTDSGSVSVKVTQQ